MSVDKLITDNLAVWTGAVTRKSTSGRGSNGKLEMTGIKKLRELILELAVRGKLVPHFDKEEPVRELLDRIGEARASLVADGTLKPVKPSPILTDAETPAHLPACWSWVRLEEVCRYIQRGKGPKYSDNGRARVVSQKCVKWSGLDLVPARYIEDDSLKSYQRERFLLDGDVLWNSTGTGTVGRVTVAGEVNEKCLVADSHVTVIRPLLISEKFVAIYLSSPDVQKKIEPTHEDSLVSGTTKQVELNVAAVKALPIPLPPLAEQHRIVAKVDELMALCDQLEQQQAGNLQAQQALVETLLRTLVEAGDANETHQAWNRIAEHFDSLFTTEDTIDQLKQAVLQLAVMGALLPQDPEDEPAHEFLDRVAADKNRLAKVGRIRKLKNLPNVKAEEMCFPIKRGWEWARLEQFSIVGTGATPARDNLSYYEPPAFNWVTSGETEEEFIFDTKEKVSQKAIDDTNVSIYPAGTLVVAMYGQGKTRGQITELMIDAGTNQACAAISLICRDSFHRKYIKLFFEKSYEELRSQAAGGAQPNLNLGKISQTVIPIPPLAEQKRIVTKVDELMGLCNSLKARIQQAQTTQAHLADAIVEQAVA